MFFGGLLSFGYWFRVFVLVYLMPLAPARLWSSCGAFLFLLVLARRVLTKFLAQR